MGLLQQLLDHLSRRPYLLPPTWLGYQAPEGALALGWRCRNEACLEQAVWDRPQTNIPAACPECGHATEPLLAWPWWHHAYAWNWTLKPPRPSVCGTRLAATLPASIPWPGRVQT